MFREGLLVVVSGPSGTGKGTVLEQLKKKNSNIRYSISATTRKPREGEVEGRNYFYKSIPEFELMIQENRLVEWVKYCDNYYGTPREYIDECVKSGFDVILEIEVEGALNIKNKFPECVSIFILPPSFQELRRRIEGRGTESREVIEKRLAQAEKEIKLVEKYDYIVINESLERAVEEINAILTAEKLKYGHNKNILNEIGF